MASQFLTTGQAARLCSVTRDTVLKWIRSGKLPAQRTAGGHHRIDRKDLDRALRNPERFSGNPESVIQSSFRYCWEYLGSGRLPERCSRCTVYLSRALRCYEMAKFGFEAGFQGTFCQESCDDCEYFREIAGQDTKILILSDDSRLSYELQRDADRAEFELKLASCEYDCSALLNHFRPDYIIIDCALGLQFVEHVVEHLAEDTRVPVLRLILAGDEQKLPEDCAAGIFARLQRPFTIEMVNACLSSLRGRPHEYAAGQLFGSHRDKDGRYGSGV